MHGYLMNAYVREYFSNKEFTSAFEHFEHKGTQKKFKFRYLKLLGRSLDINLFVLGANNNNNNNVGHLYSDYPIKL